MDKNQSRTDLLAAGKKKLQQYRQKKENKGGSSRGKSKKSSKNQLPESDADTASVTSTGSSQVTDGNVETNSDPNVVITKSLESRSLASSEAADNVDPSVDSSSVAMAYDTGDRTELDSNAKVALEGHGVHENESGLSSQDQGGSSQNVNSDVAKDVSSKTSNSEGGTAHDHASELVAILSPHASIATAVDGSVTVEKESEKREDSLPLSEDTPNTSVAQTREDQEADDLDMTKSCQSTDANIDNQKGIPLFEAGESDQSLSRIALENTITEEAFHEAEQLDRPVELISSFEDIMPDQLSGFDKGQQDNIVSVGTSRENLEKDTLPGSSCEEMILQSNQEEINTGVRSGQDMALHEGFNQQLTLGGSAVDDPAHELSAVASTRSFDVSPMSNASSVNLLQLAEFIKGINEEEYQFLLKERGAVCDADPLTSSSVLPDHNFSEAFQRLKEELFLASTMQNIFNMQLAEQLELQSESDYHRHQLMSELSQLRDSHNEVNGNNQRLSEELANCRVELQNNSSKSVELQSQFDTAMAGVEDLSARVVELQISFEMSQKDSSDLSTELADCRSLISSLQDEKKALSETLNLVIAEKNKLAEEKEFYLCESKNLATELSGLKSSMEGVEFENSNLFDRISLVTEESNKFKAEIEHLLHEIDRLSLDLVENKDLVASLQAENSNLNGNLASSVDKIKNMEDESQSVVLENQRLSSQIVSLQEQLSIEKGERTRFEDDLKEATVHLEQLSKENVSLNSTLDEHKAKIEEIEKKHSQQLSQLGDFGNQAHVGWDQSKGLEIAVTEDSHQMDQGLDEGAAGGPFENRSEHEIFNDSLEFVSLKTDLIEVESVLVKLEKAIDQLRSQSVISGGTGEKVSLPAVSKLIQAFESKVNEDEHEVEISESQSNSFIMSTEEQVRNLRKLLSKWKLDVQSAAALFKGERDGRQIGDAKYSDLEDQFEELKQHCSDSEASNIELAVQYETVKQLLGDIEEKKRHLEEICEALKQEDIHLKAKNNELYEKLGYCHSKIIELHAELNDVKQSSNEMASVIGSQLENLQKEVTERAMLLEQGWNTTISDIVELVAKLNESVGETSSTSVSSEIRDGFNISHLLEASVSAASEMIFDLQKKLEATNADREIISTSYKEMTSKCDHLLGRNEMAIDVLQKLYSDLRKLIYSSGWSLDEDKKIDEQSEALPDLLNYNSYETIMKHLGDVLIEKLELESVTKKMKSELVHKETELEELKMKCLGLDSVGKLINDVEGVLNVETLNKEINTSPLLYLDSLVSNLVQKTKEAEIQNHTTKDEYGSKEKELDELKEKMQYLDLLRLENENEIFVLRESLHQAEEALSAARSELHEKANELDHSEQRVSSIREKLGIAVAKGKGLVVQRDGLKQSLAETSGELERCMQELKLKDTRLHELESKLKTYSEAGERVEALESELSYIRNSANALRESFLLKDSMLQRIEEVLEDLDLPEQFHSSDIIEKIDWLVRSVVGNSLPVNDWEQKDSAGERSYSDSGNAVPDSWKDDSQLQPESGDDAGVRSPSDAGFVVADSWKDDSLKQPDSGSDFQKNFEELQSKYYGLAEQNEMLEQSLMERNSLVQRWEELVNKIDMPSHLRSMEMDDRIEWVGRALAEANHHVDSLQLKIERYESYCGLLNADLEESQRRVSALQEDLRAHTSEREHLSEKLEALRHECEKLSEQTREAELENGNLHNEIISLKNQLEQKAEIEEQIFTIDGKIKKLRDLVGDALSESETEYQISDGANIDSFEELLRKLIENHASLSSIKATSGVVLEGNHSQEDDATLHEERSIDMHAKEQGDIDRYKKDLEVALSELEHLKEEGERTLEKQISLSGEVGALSKRIEELQELLNQEEQKSASAREKLNVAVRKGKSLVQQRDGLKQTIGEMSVEMEHLKSEINNREHTIAEHEQKLRQLSTYPDRLKALESESSLLKHRLEETEHHLQEKEYSLKLILNKLGEIDVGGQGHISDPVKKVEWVGKLCSDLHSSVASLEQESRKSKRASELLLAELNEVQERNDSFQEELAKVADELVDLKRERDSAEAAKLEVLSHLEKLSTLHEEEKKSHFYELVELKSGMNQVWKHFSEVQNLLAKAFFTDLESFRNLEAGLQLCVKGNNAPNVVDSSFSKEHDDILRKSFDSKKSSVYEDSWSEFGTTDHYNDNTIIESFHLFGHKLQEFLVEVSSLKERILVHSSLAREQDKTLSKLMTNIQMEITSQRESCENMKKEVSKRDLQLVALRGNIAHLYESCINSVTALENGKAELVGEKVEISDLGINLETPSFDDETSEKCIKTMADRLWLAANGFTSIKTEFLDANQKEMKATVTNLQRELQEKDVQRDRICADLVKQIKDAEAAANSYSQDLESLRMEEHNLKKQVEVIEDEKKILEQRIKELQDRQGAAAELEDKVRSQTGLLAAKDQEIEALMHALDEEEMQMEELTKKYAALDNAVQQKNQEIESLESSRGKVMKKLSVTVSKFDELHQLSASLLSEVEKLQSQLQEKDAEISFLRQEVTRCTNDDLRASQLSNQRSLDEIVEFFTWVDTIVSRDGVDDIPPDVKSDTQVHEYKEILHKKLMSLISELENLRGVAESKDEMLQAERSKVAELNHKAETLEKSLHEKESQLNLLDGVEETGRGIGTSSEIVEVEPVINEWTTTGTFVTPQVRSLRKGNSDYVAIAVDEDLGSTSRIEDEDDDKVHGFKSLTSSKIVPRFTRPVTDLIDGLWVSCDRTLMRQPVLRLGIIIYWTIMHALLAFFVV
ncbi:protein MLP1 [Trifolium repens]|nr:protein MLP1 [Trifolium repens]